MAAYARRLPARRRAAVAGAALLPMIALAAAALDGIVALAAGQLLGAAAGLR